MTGDGYVRMVGRTQGVVGELGRGLLVRDEDAVMEPVNLETLSIGPLFNKVDYRRLYWEIKKTPFFRYTPV